MSIHVILGKPGSGKSLYATTRVIRELLESQRNIVTNLPLRPDRLNEYMGETYPRACTRFVERVRILTDDEIGSFWKFRGPADDPGALGVAYFLDEAHIAFNARDWATIGRGALHYLSQHRKLGDIVWPITQSAGNLDKQFRSVSEDFTVLRNEYTAKFGPFKGRGRFVRKTYLAEPSNNAEPFETASFTLDVKGIASCYDTAKGIGVHGNKADIGRKAKGIPIWTVIPAGLALGLMCVAIPWALAKGASRVLTGGKASKPPIAAQTAGSVDKAQASAIAAFSGGVAAPVAAPVGPVASAPVVVEGYQIIGNVLKVFLSDGRKLSSAEGELLRVTKAGVWLVDGSAYPMKRDQLPTGGPVPIAAPRSEGLGVQPRNLSGVRQGGTLDTHASGPDDGRTDDRSSLSALASKQSGGLSGSGIQPTSDN